MKLTSVREEPKPPPVKSVTITLDATETGLLYRFLHKATQGYISNVAEDLCEKLKEELGEEASDKWRT